MKNYTLDELKSLFQEYTCTLSDVWDEEYISPERNAEMLFESFLKWLGQKDDGNKKELLATREEAINVLTLMGWDMTKINLIKAYRKIADCDIRQAKEAIEKLFSEYGKNV